MKLKHTFLLGFSLLLASISMIAQDTSTPADTLVKNSKYGIRVGVDISKLARTAFEDGFTGFEINADYRLTNKIYAAVELGTSDRVWDEDGLRAITNGSYIKIGADLNAYNNWLNMNNAIFGGLRYGFSTFSQELDSYNIYTSNPAFETAVRDENIEYSGLTGHWAELIVGIKTEVLNNLYLSINLQLKRKITDDKPENFDNLIIPGFNRTYDFSQFGVGYGYTISYLIPFYKK
ncbi:hypothetical protein G5B37_01715 [Rasiella rasia]|uniref:Uncharacterized protein n=1 Tax=Rasiella rasia TaxID=2744027 RepID=A0A6G6GII1_9FLAO|nr:DUF6048 family protein [Rasiella rasia]QIE58324.1 hypothetical protein G5B37_01715 [Rasiella rasia]